MVPSSKSRSLSSSQPSRSSPALRFKGLAVTLPIIRTVTLATCSSRSYRRDDDVTSSVTPKPSQASRRKCRYRKLILSQLGRRDDCDGQSALLLETTAVRDIDKSFEAALAREFPGSDPKQVLELVRMGIYRLPKRLRLGKCGAWARSVGRPCQAPAMPNGRCKLHGGLSSGPKTGEGRERLRPALRQRWVRWRALYRKAPKTVG
jgi:hypothetical protein